MRNSWQKHSTSSSNSSPNVEMFGNTSGSFAFRPPIYNSDNSFVSSTRHSTGEARTELSMYDVIWRGSLLDKALDRNGVKFLEANYPTEPLDELRRIVFDTFVVSNGVFPGLCTSPNGNIIIQKIIECSTVQEQNTLLSKMKEAGLVNLCTNKYACRVVQAAIQSFSLAHTTDLIAAISVQDLSRLTTDQCAIRVFQYIVRHVQFEQWTFFLGFLCTGDNLMMVCQDRQGCRLVQEAIDRLAENPDSSCFPTRVHLLHSVMTLVARNCFRLSSNEFANYVVQHVIKSTGVLEMYRDTIIEKCLLRNLLSMAQDKYASHVVEGAFLCAPPALLAEMMEEIFEGYVRDNNTNRDALDILMFHQYGNYVVQKMIAVCKSAEKEDRHLSASDALMFSNWFAKIRVRVHRHSARLNRFSSGKKIINAVKQDTPKKEQSPPMDFTLDMDQLYASFMRNSFF